MFVFSASWGPVLLWKVFLNQVPWLGLERYPTFHTVDWGVGSRPFAALVNA